MRAAVRQVVAVHGRQDDVAEPPPRQRLGRVLRLVRVERGWGLGRLDGAEAAAARAGVAHQHDGGGGGGFVRAAPAVGDVGAARFLADGVQVEAAQVVLDLLVVVADRDGRLEPGGEAGDLFLPAFGTDHCGSQFERIFGGEGLGVAAGEIGE